MTITDHNRTRIGVAYALAAFFAWGLNPFYFKAVANIPTLEILGHRVVWSMLFLLPLILYARQFPQVIRALTGRRTFITLAATSIIVGINWLLYIHTVEVGRVLESSLGYYINPLVNVMFGRVFLGERLSRPQIVAAILAAAGVLNLVIAYGEVPWLALGLAVTFAIYGLLRKVVAVDALPGLFIETVMLFPFAVVGLALFGHDFSASDIKADLLLILAGPVTFLPLLWFTCAARRLKLSVLGFFQFISPSIQFLLAVFVFGEHFGHAHYVTFALIWIAILIFTMAPRLMREPAVT
ncbi:MAG TPA: EamA family transporter RarD [Dongiaceae bacterium]|jgi:chloramphenicol-sensitive protein RarD